jgi:predicted ArsR family transcriptional regulator
VRQHLAKLVDADLLVEGVEKSTGRGRPRLQYTVDPSAESRWGATGPHERLSLMLSDIIRTGDSPIEVGRRPGQC